MRLTSTRSRARTFSRRVQSIVTLLRTVSTSSRAMARSVWSPNTFTAGGVCLQRVVERQLVLGEPERLPASIGRAHLLRELDQLLDDLRRLDGTILVATDR